MVFEISNPNTGLSKDRSKVDSVINQTVIWTRSVREKNEFLEFGELCLELGLYLGRPRTTDMNAEPRLVKSERQRTRTSGKSSICNDINYRTTNFTCCAAEND